MIGNDEAFNVFQDILYSHLRLLQERQVVVKVLWLLREDEVVIEVEARLIGEHIDDLSEFLTDSTMINY